MYLVRAVLAPFGFAVALAYVVAPLVEAIHRRGIGRPWAILLAYACIAVVVAAVGYFVLPGLVVELQRLSDLVPRYAQRTDGFIQQAQLRYRHMGLPAPLRTALDHAVAQLRDAVEAAVRGAVGGLIQLVGGLVDIVLAPFLAYYLLADLPRLRAGLVAAVPSVARRGFVAYLEDLDRVVSGFVRGQLLLAACVGLLVALALALLGLRFALTLGLVAGLGELVPYFGPILGALPALALAAVRGPRTLAEVGAALLIVQQIESAVLGPKIVGRSTDLHPLSIVFALLAGGHFWGVAGLVLAVPTLAVVKVSVHHALRVAVTLRRGAALDRSRGQASG